MPISQEAMARFWAKVDVRGPDDCWPWTAGTDRAGYGKLKVDGRDVGAHRISCEIADGPIPAGLSVLHSCDNPPCCNPSHLKPGTGRRNLVEAVERGRRPESLRGSHPRAKISGEDAAAIRSSNLPGIVLARQFGVAKSTITFIRRGSSEALKERRRARRAEVMAGA
ncbi:HNH endonuclease [Methylobacterium sp. E-016]|jgi:hypothetical protein|uniref:HNH endonuclease signature motif containing protein n=1 Tax=Methylobacterium sp. E-016 TaxID=2836556 RepID=UPI001FBB2FCC|nr:HNH endonuclease signature motif containing protein [Methylobacterium sp. E-016]MCJ2077799.1 HNH endonuclease [Methylobacterium sp. E-016]